MEQIHITQASKTGKLEGINSINTSVLNNPFCDKMRKGNDVLKRTELSIVCEACYAATLEKQYTNLHIAITRNDNLLSSAPLSDRQLPVIMDRVLRFHSLGELINIQHLDNFCSIAKHNPDTFFVLWSKRTDLINKYFSDNDKPINLSLIYSSPKVGKIESLPIHFDKVFTVHAKKPSNDNININCHSKCKDCMLCYSKNEVIYINEVIK
jgi:hypothetical protein